MEKVRNDILLLAGILLIAFLIGIIPRLLEGKEPAVVCVVQDGRVLERYALSEDRTVSISCPDEGYNLLMISNGKAVVSDANCPDKICVRHRAISLNGESIICLPHKLVIQIESKEEGAPDALTY